MYHIDINSYIGTPFSKEYISYLLDELKDEKNIKVRINSYGGSVNDGLDIYQRFKDRGNVTAYIFGFTASAATLVALGAKRVLISKNAMVLIHKCNTLVNVYDSLNTNDIDDLVKELQKQKEQQEEVDKIIAGIYLQKFGKNLEEILSLMNEEKWITAEEAIKMGFADGYIEEELEEEKEVVNKNVLVACGLPMIEEAKKEAGLYEKIVNYFTNILQDKESISEIENIKKENEELRKELSHCDSEKEKAGEEIKNLRKALNEKEEEIQALKKCLNETPGDESPKAFVNVGKEEDKVITAIAILNKLP